MVTPPDAFFLSTKRNYEELIKYTNLTAKIEEVGKINPDYVDKQRIQRFLVLALKAADKNLNLISLWQRIHEDNESYQLNSLLAVLHLQVAYIHANPNAKGNSRIYNLDKSEEYLQKIVQFYEKHGAVRETVLPMVGGYLEYGRIYLSKKEVDQGVDFLIKTDQVLTEFRTHHENPVGYSSRFGVPNNEISADCMLDELVMKAIYLLAVTCINNFYSKYSHELCIKTLENSIAMQNRMLSRLDVNPSNIENTIKNVLLFAEYFRKEERFPLARHQLGAASYCLHKLHLLLLKEDKLDNDKYIPMFHHWTAAISFNWAMYGLKLLHCSQKYTVQKMVEDHAKGIIRLADADLKNLQETLVHLYETSELSLCSTVEFDIERLKYRDIELEIEAHSNAIPDQYVDNVDDALSVYTRTKQLFDEADDYYTAIQDFKSKAKVVKSVGDLYITYMLFTPEDTRASYIKKKIEAMEECLATWLQPDVFIDECREFWLLLVSAYLDLVRTKYGKLDLRDMNPEQRADSDEICAKIGEYSRKFQDSMRV